MSDTPDPYAQQSEPLPAIFLAGSEDSTALTTKIDALEKQLEAEQDCRREDRFLGLVIIMALVDVIVLGDKTAPVSGIVLVLELILLFIIAKRMGVEQLAGILDGILSSFAKKRGE